MKKEEFITAWNEAGSLKEFLEATGYSYNTAVESASRYRRKGERLKYWQKAKSPKPPKPSRPPKPKPPIWEQPKFWQEMTFTNIGPRRWRVQHSQAIYNAIYDGTLGEVKAEITVSFRVSGHKDLAEMYQERDAAIDAETSINAMLQEEAATKLVIY